MCDVTVMPVLMSEPITPGPEPRPDPMLLEPLLLLFAATVAGRQAAAGSAVCDCVMTPRAGQPAVPKAPPPPPPPPRAPPGRNRRRRLLHLGTSVGSSCPRSLSKPSASKSPAQPRPNIASMAAAGRDGFRRVPLASQLGRITEALVPWLGRMGGRGAFAFAFAAPPFRPPPAAGGAAPSPIPTGPVDSVATTASSAGFQCVPPTVFCTVCTLSL